MKTVKLTILLGLTLALAGCATQPPTKIEAGLYDIQTNYTPQVSIKTNYVAVTLYQTNTVSVPVTNEVGVTSYKTNEVVVARTESQPRLSFETNPVVAGYVYTPGQGVKDAQQVATAAGNIIGVGGIAGTGLGVLAAIWGYVRSKKTYVTAGNLAQTIETMRAFLKSLPNGAVMDNQLTSWMQQHQADAGVLNQVLELLKTEVSSDSADVAARQIQGTLSGLLASSGVTPPTPPASPLAAAPRVGI